MNRTDIIRIAPGQTVPMFLGRRTLKSGKLTKGTLRNVKVTGLTPGGIEGTYKVNGVEWTSVWSWGEIERATN